MARIPDLAQMVGLQDLDAVLELYILDLTSLDAAQPKIRFCNWSQTNGAGVFYAGQEYQPLPVECSGFEINSNDAPSEPRMQVSNVGLTWTGLVNRWDDLVGCKLTRRRVLRRYLDDGATPSPTGHWPDEPWFIEQKISENKLSITFALATAFALDELKLPRRLALRHTCSWTYRSEACGYVGPPVADIRDQPLGSSSDPTVQAYFNAVAAFHAQGQAVAYWVEQVRITEAAYNASTVDAWTLSGEWYNFNWPQSWVYFWPPFSFQWWMGITTAYFGGVPVTLDPNGTWRAGEKKQEIFNGSSYWSIQYWVFTPGNRAQAEAAMNAARAGYAYSANLLEVRRAEAYALRAAAGAVIDPRDQCSKTLQGCRLRFFDPITGAIAPLPTSAFPGLQIG